MKQRYGIILAILVFAAACGGHSKEKAEKYVFFDMSLSGDEISSDVLINSMNLIAEGHKYQRPLKNGHAQFFANVKERQRKIQLDFAHKATEGSMLTDIVNRWGQMPAATLNGCQLGYQDLVSLPTNTGSYEYRLETFVNQANVLGNDCSNKLTQSISFALALQNGQIAGTGGVACMVKHFPKPFTAVLSDLIGELRGASKNKPWNTDLLCNPTLPDGTPLVTSAGSSQYGYQFWIQNYETSDYDIDRWGSFTGFLVHIDENGNVTNIKPHTPPAQPPVATTSVNLMVRGYSGLQHPLAAYCDFNGTWSAVPMALNYATGTTLVVSQTVVYSNVATGKQYACNFMDTVTGQWIYFPPPSTASTNYVFLANGTQVVEPAGNNLRISLDGTAQIVVTRHSIVFTAIADPGSTITPEVRLIIGNTGSYVTYPMSLVNGNWQVSLSLPYGTYEADVVYSGGAYYWLTDDGTEAGQFYVADTTANMALPGVRLDPLVDAIMYASPVTTAPTFLISHRRYYSFRIDVTGINGINFLTVSVGLNVGP